MKKIIVAVALAVIGISIFCAKPVVKGKTAVKPEAVTITFNRPDKAGDTYTIDTHLKFHSIRVQGFGMQASRTIKDVEADFSAGIRIIRVNKVGQPTMLFCTVKKANILEDGKKKDPGLDGVQLGITFPENKIHLRRRDNKPVNDEAKFLISQIIRPPDGVNPDDYLSAKRPVRPGESWKADAKVLAGMLSTEDVTVKPSEIHAQATFKGMEKWNGIDCCRIEVSVTADKLTRPSFMGTMSLKQKEDLLLPVRTDTKAYQSTSTFANNFSGKYMAGNALLIPVKDKTNVTIKTVVR